jgi:hypothetical protein
VITGPQRGASRRAAAATAVIASMLALAAIPVEARAGGRPALVLDAEITRADVTIATSAIDYTDYWVDSDWAQVQKGVELSIFIARGDLHQPAEDGIIPTRTTYSGPLRIEIIHSSGDVSDWIEFREPNSPMSAQRRRIYRARLSSSLLPGDTVRIEAIPDWFDEAVVLEVPRRGSRIGAGRLVQYFAVSALGFSALLSLAFVGRAS